MRWVAGLLLLLTVAVACGSEATAQPDVEAAIQVGINPLQTQIAQLEERLTSLAEETSSPARVPVRAASSSGGVLGPESKILRPSSPSDPINTRNLQRCLDEITDAVESNSGSSRFGPKTDFGVTTTTFRRNSPCNNVTR